MPLYEEKKVFSLLLVAFFLFLICLLTLIVFNLDGEILNFCFICFAWLILEALCFEWFIKFVIFSILIWL